MALKRWQLACRADSCAFLACICSTASSMLPGSDDPWGCALLGYPTDAVFNHCKRRLPQISYQLECKRHMLEQLQPLLGSRACRLAHPVLSGTT